MKCAKCGEEIAQGNACLTRALDNLSFCSDRCSRQEAEVPLSRAGVEEVVRRLHEQANMVMEEEMIEAEDFPEASPTTICGSHPGGWPETLCALPRDHEGPCIASPHPAPFGPNENHEALSCLVCGLPRTLLSSDNVEGPLCEYLVTLIRPGTSSTVGLHTTCLVKLAQQLYAEQVAHAVDHLPEGSTLIQTEKLDGMKAEMVRLKAEVARLQPDCPCPDCAWKVLQLRDLQHAMDALGLLHAQTCKARRRIEDDWNALVEAARRLIASQHDDIKDGDITGSINWMAVLAERLEELRVAAKLPDSDAEPAT